MTHDYRRLATLWLWWNELLQICILNVGAQALVFCGCSLSWLPFPFPKKTPLVLCPTAFCAFKAFTTSQAHRADSEKRLVLQANPETHRLGQHGHGQSEDSKPSQFLAFPSHAEGGSDAASEEKPWAMSGTRLASAFLNPKAFRVPKGIWIIQALVFISTLAWFLCILIRSTHCWGWAIGICSPLCHIQRMLLPRSPSGLSPSAAEAVCFSIGDVSNMFYCWHKRCSIRMGWLALA